MCRLTLDTLDLGTGDLSIDVIAIIAAKGPFAVLGAIMLRLYAVLIDPPTSWLVRSGDWEFPLGGFGLITLALTRPDALNIDGFLAFMTLTSICLLILVLEPAVGAWVRGFRRQLPFEYQALFLGYPVPILWAFDLYFPVVLVDAIASGRICGDLSGSAIRSRASHVMYARNIPTGARKPWERLTGIIDLNL